MESIEEEEEEEEEEETTGVRERSISTQFLMFNELQTQ